MDFSKTRKSPILLQEVNRSYAFDLQKPMRGFVRLENSLQRGIVTTVIENIKFFPRGDYVYRLLLRGMKKEQPMYHLLGSLSLSALGRGEGTFRINPSDLDGQGNGLWEFDSIIVAAAAGSDSREPLHPILQGNFRIPRPEGTARTATPKDYSPFYHQFVLERCIAIAQKQRQLDDIRPFRQDATSARWKKILDPALFPILSPGSENAVKIYGHFIWGWNDTHYFLGVPGRFLSAEQPDGGRSGFAFWQPILGMEALAQDTSLSREQRRQQTYGYWIASISRATGRIEEFPYQDRTKKQV